MAELLVTTGIEHKVTSAYNPRTNGMTERLNQTLIEALRKHTESNPLDWDKWIPYVLLAYRSRIHSSTKFTPFELVFGRKMNTFEDWSSEPSTNEVATLCQRANEIKELVEKTHVKAKENIKSSQNRQIQIQDKQNNVTTEILQEDTSVFIKAEGLNGKLSPRYYGPYKIVNATYRGNYIIKNALGESIKMSYPRHKLKVVNSANEEDFDITAAAKNENNKLKDSNTQESNHAMTTRSKQNSTNTVKLNYLVFFMAFLALICGVFGGNTPIYGNFNFCHSIGASILNTDNSCK